MFLVLVLVLAGHSPVSLLRETVEISATYMGLGCQVQKLPQLGLSRGLDEQVYELGVVFLPPEIPLQDLIHTALEDKGVVDGNLYRIIHFVQESHHIIRGYFLDINKDRDINRVGIPV